MVPADSAKRGLCLFRISCPYRPLEIISADAAGIANRVTQYAIIDIPKSIGSIIPNCFLAKFGYGKP